jgi:hypothetical protein
LGLDACEATGMAVLDGGKHNSQDSKHNKEEHFAVTAYILSLLYAIRVYIPVESD